MRVKVLRDFAAKSGMVVRKGGVLEFEDDADAYEAIHAGHAEPPLRLRSAIEGLIGRRNVEVGELVDMPGDGPWFNGRDDRVEPLAAVVAAGDDAATAVPPLLALQLIAAGGRYATREEAEGLDLGGADRVAKPAPTEPTGPTERLFFLNATQLPDGRVAPAESVVEVPAGDVEALTADRKAERLVEARVKAAGVIVSRWCEVGEVALVPRSLLASRPEQLERVGAAEKAAAAVFDVLGAIGEKAAVVAEKVARPAGKRAAAAASGDAR